MLKRFVAMPCGCMRSLESRDETGKKGGGDVQQVAWQPPDKGWVKVNSDVGCKDG